MSRHRERVERGLYRDGAAAWSINGRWNAVRGVLAHAARQDLLAANRRTP